MGGVIHDRVVQLNPGVWTVRSARNNHRDSEDTEGAQRSVFINKPSVGRDPAKTRA